MTLLDPRQHSTLRYRTLADLDHLRAELDQVPASRIWLIPLPGTATEEDCVQVVTSANRRSVELVNGTLVEKTVGYQESMLGVWIASVILRFLEKRDLGVTLGENGMYRMRQGNIREPDASFTSWNDLPGGELPPGKVIPVGPTLAVEVLSESNTVQEMQTKRREYFESGTQLVWQIDLVRRTVEVFSDPQTATELTSDQILDGGNVLPGLEIRLADLFNVVDAAHRKQRSQN